MIGNRWIVATIVSGVILGAPSSGLASSEDASCRVRNVTQGTAGISFNQAVKAARDGDRLVVRGTCVAGVAIGVDLRIIGAVGPRAVLTGKDAHRILRVRPDATVTLRHLALARGREPSGDAGGAIRNLGTLTITGSLVRGNQAYSGGGISNWGGAVTITGSVVHGNEAMVGGGIAHAGGTMVMTDSVVRANTAEEGGGIWNGGTLRLVASMVTENRATERGGGIFNGKADRALPVGTVRLRAGSVVAGNTPDECVGTDAC